MSKTIWIVDIESLENRYTAQWRKDIPKIFEKNTGLTVKTISGTDYEGTSKGGFFDFTKTMRYKGEQQVKIADMLSSGEIKDGDILFFTDAFTPTVMAVKYMINMNDRDIKMYGYIHTNSYDESDILYIKGNHNWANHFERSMFECLEKVYVATYYHLDQIKEHFPEYVNKFRVAGNYVDVKTLEKYNNMGIKKEKIMLFPHRINEDKQPELFEELKQYFPEYEFIYTQDKKRSKDEYYKLLAKSEIVLSFSKHENFGISMVESVLLGCKVFMPNDKSYKEMYAKELQYDRILEKDIKQYSYWLKGILKDPNLEMYLEKSRKNIKENYCNFSVDFDEMKGK